MPHDPNSYFHKTQWNLARLGQLVIQDQPSPDQGLPDQDLVQQNYLRALIARNQFLENLVNNQQLKGLGLTAFLQFLINLSRDSPIKGLLRLIEVLALE